MDDKIKIIVILGPTACGKTSFAVRLAAQIDGAIVSADSRQLIADSTSGAERTSGNTRFLPAKLWSII